MGRLFPHNTVEHYSARRHPRQKPRAAATGESGAQTAYEDSETGNACGRGIEEWSGWPAT